MNIIETLNIDKIRLDMIKLRLEKSLKNVRERIHVIEEELSQCNKHYIEEFQDLQYLKGKEAGLKRALKELEIF